MALDPTHNNQITLGYADLAAFLTGKGFKIRKDHPE
jgi:hypothetical protein